MFPANSEDNCVLKHFKFYFIIERKIARAAGLKHMESQEAGGRSVRTVKLWIKAFIPSTYERAVVVSGTGAHAGKTMVTGSWVMNRCFLTDQRSFSSDIHADARMHSEIEIDVAKGKETYQFHHCYDTIEIDPQ